jgi:hypothetical protein
VSGHAPGFDSRQRTTVCGFTTMRTCSMRTKLLVPTPRITYQTSRVSALEVFASVPPIAVEERVLEKQPVTTLEGLEDRTRQTYKRVHHPRVLSRSACEWQTVSCRDYRQTEFWRTTRKSTSLSSTQGSLRICLEHLFQVSQSNSDFII